ncbi:hypothetical protein M0804_013814 [Polistes exclamans]|nr:hypothetical protein M0804_013814 [Polistes exclamans]
MTANLQMLKKRAGSADGGRRPAMVMSKCVRAPYTEPNKHKPQPVSSLNRLVMNSQLSSCCLPSKVPATLLEIDWCSAGNMKYSVARYVVLGSRYRWLSVFLVISIAIRLKSLDSRLFV